jgi:hypothetical protein
MMRFKIKGFQLLTLVIVFLLIYPGNLAAKKRGAYLVVEKQDGQVIEGELLNVKQNSLLVMTSASGNGVTIDINEIIKIRMKKKLKFMKGVLKGFLIGGGIGTLMALSQKNNDQGGFVVIGPGVYVLTGMVLGTGAGGVVGLLSSNYKTIRVKGKSPSEIKKIIKKLKKKARFKT